VTYQQGSIGQLNKNNGSKWIRRVVRCKNPSRGRRTNTDLVNIKNHKYANPAKVGMSSDIKVQMIKETRESRPWK